MEYTFRRLGLAVMALAGVCAPAGCDRLAAQRASTPAEVGADPCATAAPPAAAAATAPTICLAARVVAVGLQSVHGVRQVGMFHAGGAIPGNAAFLMQTRPGKVLDPQRLLVTSESNFGAPLAHAGQSPGAVLSIDPQTPRTIVVPPQFAAGGGQAEAADGAVKLYTAQSAAFLNQAYNPRAATALAAAVSGPRYVSVNNAFGRPWIANSPSGSDGAGSNSVLDPDGRPLDNAPSERAGGVFAGVATNRTQVLARDGRSGVAARALDYRDSTQLTPGNLSSGALGTAFLGASPDGSNFAVFAVATADGAVVQVHVQDGVDGLAPSGTLAPVAPRAADTGARGMAFKWNADRVLYVADPGRNRVAALHLGDDTRQFKLVRMEELRSDAMHEPVDVTPCIPEVASPRFASLSTLAAGSDLYVANRGDGTLLRLSQDGHLHARAVIHLTGHGPLGAGRLRAIAVSADASRLWLSAQGEAPGHPGRPGLLLEVSAFDMQGPYRSAPRPTAGRLDLAREGEAAFRKDFTAAEGLGPAFNAGSCIACHGEPTIGGMTAHEGRFVLRLGRVHPVSGRSEPLSGLAAPVARRHAVSAHARAVVPREANVTSLRMPTTLYDVAQIERIPEESILVHAVNKGDGIQGRPNRVTGADGRTRVGRFGWKSDVADLQDMVSIAFDNELGIRSALYPALTGATTKSADGIEDDGTLVRAVSAFLRGLSRPKPEAMP